VNGVILSEYDPFKGNEVHPFSVGFTNYYFYLHKDINKLIFEKTTEPCLSSAINVQSLQSFYVPEATKIAINIHKLLKSLMKKGQTIDDYIQTHREKSKVEKALYTVLTDHDLRSRCLENPSFIIYLIMKNSQRIEIITQKYKEFKDLLNGLNFLVNEFQSLIELSERIHQELE
jgi:hypothetical protein